MQPNEIVETLERHKGKLDAILSRFKKTRDGIHIGDGDDARLRGIVLELRDIFDDMFVEGSKHSRPLLAFYQESISNFFGSPSYHGVECVRDVVGAATSRVRRNPLALKATAAAARAAGKKDPDLILRLAERLHAIIRQLRERREQRPTLEVEDEYDVQDLFHALLIIYFDDIRKEEWSPSYAGGASRMDFLLPEVETVVEIKMMRPSLTTK